MLVNDFVSVLVEALRRALEKTGKFVDALLDNTLASLLGLIILVQIGSLVSFDGGWRGALFSAHLRNR